MKWTVLPLKWSGRGLMILHLFLLYSILKFFELYLFDLSNILFPPKLCWSLDFYGDKTVFIHIWPVRYGVLYANKNVCFSLRLLLLVFFFFGLKLWCCLMAISCMWFVGISRFKKTEKELYSASILEKDHKNSNNWLLSLLSPLSTHSMLWRFNVPTSV